MKLSGAPWLMSQRHPGRREGCGQKPPGKGQVPPDPTYGYLYSKTNLKGSAFLNSVSPSRRLLNPRGSWEPRIHNQKHGQKYRAEVWVARGPQGATGV